MNTLRLSLASASLALLPQIACAAYTSPSELFEITSRDTQPYSLSLQLSGHEEDVYMAAWVSGTSQQEPMAANIKATIDVSHPTYNVAARGKIRMIVQNNTAYTSIDSIDGTYDSPFMSAALNLAGKRWIKAELPGEVLEMQQMIRNPYGEFSVNDMFTMTSRPVDAGTEYTLHLAKNEFSQEEFEMFAHGFSSSDTDIKLEIVVVLSDAGKVVSNVSTLEMNDKTGVINVTLSLTPIKQMPAITVPADALSLDEIQTMLMNSYSSPSVPDVDWDIPEDSTWEPSDEDVWTPGTYCDETAATVRTRRIGAGCSSGRPSRRSLQR